MSVEINNELLFIMLLYCLPSSYGNFQCAIKSRDNFPDTEPLNLKILEKIYARLQKGNKNGNTAFYVETSNLTTSKSKVPNNNHWPEQNYKNKKPNIKCDFGHKKRLKGVDYYLKKKINLQSASEADKSIFLI